MNIYIVQTYYHLFIAIVKSLINNSEENYLLVFKEDINNKLLNDKNLFSRIKNSNIFSDMYFIDYSNELGNKTKITFQLKRLLTIINHKKDIMKILNKFDNIYVFNDITTIGKIVNLLKYKYILLEDGQDCFLKNMNIISNQKFLKKMVKKFLFKSSYQLGSSKNIRYIEVNDLQGLNIVNKKIIEYSKKKMFDNLSSNDIEKLLEIFDIKNVLSKFSGEYSILITQPLFQDGFLESSIEQEELYCRIIDNYLKNERIIIKTHPREILNYEKLENTYIIREKFPLELINYCMNIKINKAVTISSTSIDTIYNCKEKIILGWEILEEYKGD